VSWVAARTGEGTPRKRGRSAGTPISQPDSVESAKGLRRATRG
jgi:hypothetical protein